MRNNCEFAFRISYIVNFTCINLPSSVFVELNCIVGSVKSNISFLRIRWCFRISKKSNVRICHIYYQFILNKNTPLRGERYMFYYSNATQEKPSVTFASRAAIAAVFVATFAASTATASSAYLLERVTSAAMRPSA